MSAQPVSYLLRSLTLVLAGLWCGACDVAVDTVEASASHQQPQTQARLETRVRERLAALEAQDIVGVHARHTPSARREQGLGAFAQRMEYHRYERCRFVETVAVEGEQAYVRTTALWTPNHPKAREARLEPGQTLTQEVGILETWRYEDGDWGWVTQERESDFFEARPELLRRP